MAKQGSFRDFDWILLGFVLFIAGLGVLQIYSATISTKFAEGDIYIKQMYWLAAGTLLMFVISRIDYHIYLEYIHWAYLASIAALLAVKVVGVQALGAKRWIKLP